MRGGVVAAVLALATPTAAAPSSLTIAARPTVVNATAEVVQLYGRISSGRAGEIVQIEISECGGHGWRILTHAETTSFGAWNANAGPSVTTKFRSRWHNATSSVITVHARPYIFVDNQYHHRLLVLVRGKRYFERALLQRHVGRRWLRMRSFVLARSSKDSGADLHVRLAAGTRVRIVLTQAQVGRCYLPAAATTVVT
jgi:hypothetical protein